MNFDHSAALAQIGPSNLMAIGAHDVVRSEDVLSIAVGSKRGHLSRLEVRLTAADTYSVRVVDYLRRTWDITEDVTATGIYADDLGATVRRMGDR